MSLSQRIVTWVPVNRSMPDDDETVLVYAPDASEPVWLGYHDGADWYGVDGSIAPTVTHWAVRPEGPK